ncbi:GNS1/SUR4 family-domain-containing protein [Chlamydoabsidia padenii]|nr:GNS1/SUR4 family-domain-containing protein [Chlamydoabsidia padenii]
MSLLIDPSDALTKIPGIPYSATYEFFMDWKTPLILSTVYALSVYFLNPPATQAKLSRVEARNQGQGTTTQSTPLFYSMVTFFNMVPYILRSYHKGVTLREAYYEVVDTIIILLKGRRSSLLQTYHHAGGMIAMWAGIRFRSQAVWIFVVLNSVVHSILYTYYALTSVGIHRFVIWIHIIYAVLLTWMFLNFARSTFGKRLSVKKLS